jgi:NADH-quinone oxidoreductase subunit M
MPGSANFVGEFLILLGVFKAKLAIAIVASSGVAMASVYALRLFIRAMHNRVGPRVRSYDINIFDGAVLVPLLAVIVFLALYPQGALKRSEDSVKASVASAQTALLSLPPAQAGLAPTEPTSYTTSRPCHTVSGRTVCGYQASGTLGASR